MGKFLAKYCLWVSVTELCVGALIVLTNDPRLGRIPEFMQSQFKPHMLRLFFTCAAFFCLFNLLILPVISISLFVKRTHYKTAFLGLISILLFVWVLKTESGEGW